MRTRGSPMRSCKPPLVLPNLRCWFHMTGKWFKDEFPPFLTGTVFGHRSTNVFVVCCFVIVVETYRFLVYLQVRCLASWANSPGFCWTPCFQITVNIQIIKHIKKNIEQSLLMKTYWCLVGNGAMIYNDYRKSCRSAIPYW